MHSPANLQPRQKIDWATQPGTTHIKQRPNTRGHPATTPAKQQPSHCRAQHPLHSRPVISRRSGRSRLQKRNRNTFCCQQAERYNCFPTPCLPTTRSGAAAATGRNKHLYSRHEDSTVVCRKLLDIAQL